MLSHNLNRQSATAPIGVFDKKTLSKNGVWGLKDLELAKNFKDQQLCLQVISVKPQDEGSKFKAKYVLSDGTVCIIALAMSNLAVTPSAFDVIMVTNFQMRDMGGKTFMILKDPISLERTGLTSKIGSPQDIQKIKTDQTGVNFDQEFAIPQLEKAEEVVIPT